MKLQILSISITIWAGLLVAGFVLADTANVTATVTVQNLSLVVTDGTVAYGNLDVSTSQDTLSGQLNDEQNAVNTGNVTEDMNIIGIDTGAWTLENAVGSLNEYRHEFSTDSGSLWYNLQEAGYSTLGTGVSAAATQTFDLRITTPSSTDNYTEQSPTVTVQAVAG